jgi:hydrogenase-4 membrane subunit HyfE
VWESLEATTAKSCKIKKRETQKLKVEVTSLQKIALNILSNYNGTRTNDKKYVIMQIQLQILLMAAAL